MSNSHADCIWLSSAHNGRMPPIEHGAVALESLGERIAFMRELKEWSGAELARQCGYSQNTIWSLENNKVAEPSAKLIWAVAEALEVTPEYLWTGEGGADEALLIAAFRELSGEQRLVVLRAAGVDTGPDGAARKLM